MVLFNHSKHLYISSKVSDRSSWVTVAAMFDLLTSNSWCDFVWFQRWLAQSYSQCKNWGFQSYQTPMFWWTLRWSDEVYMMIWRYSALQRIDALLHLCDVLANASSTQDHVITLDTITVDSYKYQLIVRSSKGTVWHGRWTVTGLPFLQNKRWPHAMYYNVIIIYILDNYYGQIVNKMAKQHGASRFQPRSGPCVECNWVEEPLNPGKHTKMWGPQ